MPIILLQNGDKKSIHILDQAGLQALQASHSPDILIQNIRDCKSADLVGLEVYDQNEVVVDLWPLDHQLFSKQLVEKMAPILCVEQNASIIKGWTNEEKKIFIAICSDRPFIIILMTKDDQDDVSGFVEKPNSIYELNIPSVPVCHLGSQFELDLAVSEAVVSYDDDIKWNLSKEGYYQIDVQKKIGAVSFLHDSEDLYDRLITPFLNMVATLHNKGLNHGDIWNENLVVSNHQIIFFDFETLGCVPCITEDNQEGYHAWQLARLYDLYGIASAIKALAETHLHTESPLVAYFADLEDKLGNIDDAWHTYYNLEQQDLDIQLIDGLKDVTIENIIDDIQKLRIETLASTITAESMGSQEHNTSNLLSSQSIFVPQNQAITKPSKIPVEKHQIH